MSGIRPQEVVEVLRCLEEEAGAGRPVVLATAVSLDGSVFPRSGLPGLLALEGPRRSGLISLSELPAGLRRAAEEAAGKAAPALCCADLAEDDAILGYGLGAPGRVEFLLEPVDGRLRAELRLLREALLKGKGLVYAVEIEGPGLGRRTLYPADHPQARECYEEMSPELIENVVEGKVSRRFFCPLPPMGKAIVFGSGPDAAAHPYPHLVSSTYAEIPYGRLAHAYLAKRRVSRVRRRGFGR